MCYPKPGPRCSGHALKRLQDTEKAFSENQSRENFQAYRDAQVEYESTPRGLEELKNRWNLEDNPLAKEELAQRYNMRKEAREVAMDEYKTLRQMQKTPVAPNEISNAIVSLRDEGFDASDITEDRIRSRINAQRVVDSVPDLVGLEAPGSQADRYVRDEEGKVAEVYYSSYGSNLFENRFNAYVQGGTINGTTTYDGCRDKSAPMDDVAVALPGSIFYAGESSVWSGGPAFLDPDVKGTRSLGRAYRITTEQFEDVVGQESKLPVGEYSFDSEKLLKDGNSVTPGLYGKLVHVGDYNGAPVLTFTAPFTSRQAMTNEYSISEKGDLERVSRKRNAELKELAFKKTEQVRKGEEVTALEGSTYPVFVSAPAKAYTDTISNGLTETHGLSKAQARIYFNGSVGAYGNVSK